MEHKLAMRAIMLVAGMACAGQPVFAQAVQTTPNALPNPGRISAETDRAREQIQQRNDPQLQGPAILSTPASPASLGVPGGPTIVLKSVTFSKSEFLSQAELDAIIAPYVGKKVDAYKLQVMLKAVNDLYAQKGIVTALAFLPQQNLQSGFLKVTLVEGRVGEVLVQNNRRLPADAVKSAIVTEGGKVVDVPRLGRDVAWFNRTHNAQVQASLQPGVGFGLTNIALSVVEPAVNVVQIFTDNQGTKSVGQYQGGLNYQRYGLFGFDEKLTLYGVASKGNRSVNGAVNVPFNPWGGRVGVSTSYGTTHVIQGPYKSLQITGHSVSYSLNASQPLYIDQTWQALLNASLTQGRASSKQSGTPVTDNTTNKVSLGVTLGYLSELLTVSISPNITFARTKFKITETAQKFYTYNGTANASLRLPQEFIGTFAGGWQITSDTILPGDQLFQVGGPTTVRGYATGAAAGYAGYYGNFELHRPLNMVYEGLDAFAFYDRGEIFSTFPKQVKLNSVGLGLSLDYKRFVVAEVSVGVPLTRVVDHQSPYQIYFRLTSRFESDL